MTIEVSEGRYTDRIAEKNRKLIISSSVFGIIRQHLVRNIGIERLKDFLFHYGWEMGVNDAKEIMRNESSIEELVKIGPLRHIENGHIKGMDHDCTVKHDDNQNLVSVHGRGIWVDSYEAEEHIKQLGISDQPVCHTLIGYASGYMSTVFGESVYAKEIECVGKGDPVCRWETKTKRQWERENEEIFHKETPILKELEVTYEQLLEQQKLVTRLADFQKRLTEEISNGSNLQTIANIVYTAGNLPIIIEDKMHRHLAYSGLSEEKYLHLKEDMEKHIEEHQTDLFQKQSNQFFPFRKKIIKTDIQERIITPILVQKEIIGYCAFIYEDMKEHNHEEDFLFLDRFANATSLILLNEKTKFESFERMKGNFLEQILDGKLPAAEIIKRGRYTGLDLEKPYYITIMNHKERKSSIEEEFQLQEQIYETTFRYFNEQNHNLLVGHRDGNMVLFTSAETINHSTINKLIEEYHQFISKLYPQGEFKFGISGLGDRIESAPKLFEKAVIALRLTIKRDISSFQSLGIIGMLITSENMNGIKRVAEQELGSLYNLEDPKTVELLKTLYYFLLNGGKLEQTMNELALSMSGLRHRINKIESLLEKDLRDSNETHQLLLIIKSLIALGELNLD
ncbi:V4R domain-containing protein [Peribacillus loiseleuriae]|uniref:V4R domain-containing protein n=1 Tax=Peribacillus loiseleuriae TaxID=1679170 RepID=UPI003D08A52D